MKRAAALWWAWAGLLVAGSLWISGTKASESIIIGAVLGGVFGLVSLFFDQSERAREIRRAKRRKD